MVLTRSSTKKDSARQPEESSSRPTKRPKLEDTAAFSQGDHVSTDRLAVHGLDFNWQGWLLSSAELLHASWLSVLSGPDNSWLLQWQLLSLSLK